MSRRRRQRNHNGPGIIAVDSNHLPMLEVDRQHALRAVAAGRAQVLDLKTWSRLSLREVGDLRKVSVIIFPAARAISEHRLGLGRGSRGVLKRDNYECGYCGKRATTVDHINPVCQGGATKWQNLVACCFPCNQKKGGRTPEQAGMRLRFQVRSPRFLLYERFQQLAESA